MHKVQPTLHCRYTHSRGIEIRTSEAARGAVSLKSIASVCDVAADRTTIKPPPPTPLAIGYTTPRQRAAATAASTAWPPARRNDAPISEQRASSAATTASIDSTASPACTPVAVSDDSTGFLNLLPPSNQVEFESTPKVRRITETKRKLGENRTVI